MGLLFLFSSLLARDLRYLEQIRRLIFKSRRQPRVVPIQYPVYLMRDSIWLSCQPFSKIPPPWTGPGQVLQLLYTVHSSAMLWLHPHLAGANLLKSSSFSTHYTLTRLTDTLLRASPDKTPWCV
ncbi:hypothetical protein F5Y03DRAFT_260377 [Xylaria venustula]|nr:hypothetical protein F5Y03DRAFT_260377 [Xylaria venustula]